MMQKEINERLIRLKKAIDSFIKSDEDDNLRHLLRDDYDEYNKLVDYTNQYETIVANYLKTLGKSFLQSVGDFAIGIEDGSPAMRTILDMISSDMLDKAKVPQDDFERATKTFLTATTKDLTADISKRIDKDVVFNSLNKDAVDFIDSWSHQLAHLIKVGSHSTLKNILRNGIENGKSIEQVAKDLKDEYGFSRKRARRIALTEVLTAHSVATQNSFEQSPSVKGKKWVHSGSKKNMPRDNHVAISGQVIGVYQLFDLGSESAMYPRDTDLSAKERVNCHCYMTADIDEAILGLSADEKRFIVDTRRAGQETYLDENNQIQIKPANTPKTGTVKAPTKMPKPKTGTSMRELEDSIRFNNVETGAIFKPNDLTNPIWVNKGNANSVNIVDARDKDLMRGNILTHNHPSSSPFSDADIMILLNDELSEVRAVSELADFSMKTTDEYRLLMSSMNDAQKIVWKDKILQQIEDDFDFYSNEYIKTKEAKIFVQGLKAKGVPKAEAVLMLRREAFHYAWLEIEQDLSKYIVYERVIR